MAELRNRQWLLAARPKGLIKESDFKWNETTTRALKDGELLSRNLAFSFDPTQRGWMSYDTYMKAIPLGETMKAGTVGQVVESKRDGFAKGDLVQGLFGWEEHTITNGEGLRGLQKLPAGTDPLLALSLLGTTGLTAYVGLLECGQPKAGETVVVSGAAGATGSVVGMIAKIKGSRVVGIAGGPEKCQWLTKEAGFDAAIDYKNENVGEALTRRCPKGVDIYFDNVGGEILDLALARIAFRARVVLCGAISQYNEAAESPGIRQRTTSTCFYKTPGWRASSSSTTRKNFRRRSRTCRSGWPKAGSSTRSISPKASRTRRRRSSACSRAPTSASSS
jgi:NADPH-dependent curcumin reductase